jgi:hypothetical protein
MSFRKYSTDCHRNQPHSLGGTPVYALCRLHKARSNHMVSVTVMRFALHVCVFSCYTASKRVPLLSNERNLQYHAFNYIDGSVLKSRELQDGRIQVAWLRSTMQRVAARGLGMYSIGCV